MRNFNKYITPLMIILFLLHSFFASLEYLGLYNNFIHMSTSIFAIIFSIFVILHAIVGIIFAIKGFKNVNRTKTYYIKANKYYYIKIISGILMIIFIIFHMVLFIQINKNYQLAKTLNIPLLIINIFLYLSMLIHLLVSIKPFMITWGIDNKYLKIGIEIFLILLFIYLLIANIIFVEVQL